VQSVVIPGTSRFVAEEAPDEMLAALTAFLAPYRAGLGRLVALRPFPTSRCMTTDRQICTAGLRL
jgi:hypothetical protein